MERDRKKILVTGAGGMVGSYVREMLCGCNLVLTDITAGYLYLDIKDKKAVEDMIINVKPQYVLHLAAATDVDRCEVEPDWAFKVNVEGTRNVAEASKTAGAAMVYVSTANVFDGKKETPYTENDKPGPLNKYGMSKYEGEKIVASLLKNFYIVRASWMIGGGRADKKFAGKIVNKIMSGEKNIKVVNDKFGSLTYAKDLISGIGRLIPTGKFGIYHMTNGGMYSRYDVAEEIRHILKRQDVKIAPVSSDEFPLSAPRIRSEALENYNLKRLKLNYMQPWKKALEHYVLKELLPLYNE